MNYICLFSTSPSSTVVCNYISRTAEPDDTVEINIFDVAKSKHLRDGISMVAETYFGRQIKVIFGRNFDPMRLPEIPGYVYVLGYTDDAKDRSAALRLSAARPGLFKFPLIEQGITRHQCVEMLARTGFTAEAKKQAKILREFGQKQRDRAKGIEADNRIPLKFGEWLEEVDAAPAEFPLPEGHVLNLDWEMPEGQTVYDLAGYEAFPSLGKSTA